MDDLPRPVVDALLDDATAMLSGRAGCPTARLEPADRDRGWRLGPHRPAVTVHGPAAAVLGWLIGRSAGADLPVADHTGAPAVVPRPPRWL
jgi:maleylpyruvate isomerase